MKIGIDARMLGSNFGLARYVEQLVNHLQKIDTQNEYILFMRQNNWRNFEPQKPNFRKVLADIPWYGWSEQIKMPRIIKKEKVDLMHFPHWNVPYFYNHPFVVTVHDLILLHYPSRQASTLDPLKYWSKNLGWRLTLNHATKNSKQIITISEFSKNDIHQSLNIPKEKIKVTLLAPLAELKKSANQSIANHSSKKPFVLYVGVAYPHKNLERLVAAWQLYQQKYGPSHHLLLVGKKNYFYQRLLNKIKEEKKPNITYIDNATDLELQKLYQQTALFITPSLYEGFGLPALEAMQAGAPVICSNTASLPEILGKAAYYFNPTNLNEMAAAINKGLTDQNWRQESIKNAPVVLQKYSWENTAKKTLEIYKSSV